MIDGNFQEEEKNKKNGKKDTVKKQKQFTIMPFSR